MGRFFVAVVVSWLAGASQLSWFITSAANVRLREAASTTSPIVRELPLGTWVERVGTNATSKTSDGWLRVRTRDGAEGWITAALTRPLDPSRPLPAIEDIVRARLPSTARFEGEPRGGGESFASRGQLVRFVEEAPVDPADRESVARFALYQLRALLYALDAVPFRRDGVPPYQPWLKARASAIRYNEPGGDWMLEYGHVRRIYDQHRDTPAADEIAWLLVTNGLAGECEGDLPCAVSWSNRLAGEYLRLQPAGSYVAAAHARIASGLGGYLTNVESFPRVLAEFVPARRCGELKSSLDPLRAAVMASESVRKADALAAIARYERLCDGGSRVQSPRSWLGPGSNVLGSSISRARERAAYNGVNAPVAQGIEHRPSKPRVPGSNPGGRARFHPTHRTKASR
jgi:hypothetical protein